MCIGGISPTTVGSPPLRSIDYCEVSQFSSPTFHPKQRKYQMVSPPFFVWKSYEVSCLVLKYLFYPVFSDCSCHSLKKLAFNGKISVSFEIDAFICRNSSIITESFQFAFSSELELQHEDNARITMLSKQNMYRMRFIRNVFKIDCKVITILRNMQDYFTFSLQKVGICMKYE